MRMAMVPSVEECRLAAASLERVLSNQGVEA